MTNSETTELHNNQDKALYEKLATDEQDKAHDKKHPFKLDVEIKLNEGVKESNTDEADSEKRKFCVKYLYWYNCCNLSLLN